MISAIKNDLAEEACEYISASIEKWKKFSIFVNQEHKNSSEVFYRSLVLDFQNEMAKTYPDTSRGGEALVKTPIGDFSYSYQRTNLKWLGDDWMTLIHGQHATGFTQAGALKRSGMAALETVFSYIKEQKFSLQVSPEPYFETIFKLKRLPKTHYMDVSSNYFGNEYEALLLDTSSRKWPNLPIKKGSLKFIFVDTACVEANHKSIKVLCDDAYRLGIGLILVRSHLKLDCFGLDLNTLGSIVVLIPDSCTDDIRELIEIYVQNISDKSKNDDAFRLKELYPWLGCSKFFEISTDSIEKIKHQSNELLNVCRRLNLPQEKFVFYTYPHELYFSIVLNFDVSHIEEKSISKEIVTLCRKSGQNVNLAATFGLNHLVVDDFNNNTNDNGRRHIRISSTPSYVDKEKVSQCIYKVLSSLGIRN